MVSEANDVFQFGIDPREQFIYVDEMTFDETAKYLKADGKEFSDADLKKIYDKIGGNPAQLFLLFTNMKDVSLDVSIEAIVNCAMEDLVRFSLKPILQALTEHPEGVDLRYFGNQKYEGIDLSDVVMVGDVMKAQNAIAYRMDKVKRIYEMQSTRHKTAMKSYEPINIRHGKVSGIEW